MTEDGKRETGADPMALEQGDLGLLDERRRTAFALVSDSRALRLHRHRRDAARSRDVVSLDG